MKTSLEHLPQHKRDQLATIVQIIVDSVSPEKVILFGSHARGTWVEDSRMEGPILVEYISDYDILVIIKRGEERDEDDIESLIENRCKFRTPVTIIVHNIDYVNTRLAEGQYFFSDIKKEGILLYDAGNIELANEKQLTPPEKKEIAQEDFDYWYGDSLDFMKAVIFLANDKALKPAAFMLHQTAERSYNAVILVFTGYKPHTHNLGKLRALSRDFSPELMAVFPNNSKKEKHLFKLLKKAYIDARYNKSYKITEEELAELVQRVKKLQTITERICKEKLASFEREM